MAYEMWAVNIQGPDDLIPAPTREEADAACVLLNAEFRRSKTLAALGVTAIVVEWPHGYESWAADKGLFRQSLVTAIWEDGV